MDYIKLEAWRKAQASLAVLKEEEMALRKEVFKSFVSPIEGANTLELDGGWLLKATLPYTRTLDQKAGPELLKALKKVKAHAETIKVKYELSVTQYKLLTDEQRAIVDAALTTKPGTPALELVAPKG